MDTKSFARYLATGEYAPVCDAAPAVPSRDIQDAKYPSPATETAEDAAAKYLSLTEDISLQEHDDRYHGGKFDEKIMTCGLRKKFGEKALKEDIIPADAVRRAENEETMHSAARYYRDSGQRNLLKREKNPALHFDKDGNPFSGVDVDQRPPRAYRQGKPLTGMLDGAVYINGYGFKGVIGNRFWKGGRELDPTFQPGGTMSKYRLARNKYIAAMITKDDGTFDLASGDPVEKTDGYQFAFQTTDSEKPGKPTFLTDEQYDALVEQIAAETGSKPYLGNFDVPEISFHTNDLDLARKLAFGKYNQHSIWNWEKSKVEINDNLDATTNEVYK